ncbi:MAG: hypothetical protein KDI27_11670 [Gammaproteobacteria bacterium]|nr:hypothetical protein [Gammaproteobacteria bacterium]
MKTADTPALCSPHQLHGTGRVNTDNTGVQIVHYASKITEAAHLIRLGARAGLVWRLTGLEKKLVKRLYRQITGHPSPPGQTPFTDTWYRDDDLRMLQATLVWHLHRRLQRTDCTSAHLLSDVFEAYRQLVPAPLLDITRAFFVLELVATGAWDKYQCVFCGMTYLSPVPRESTACPGCCLYFWHRCRQCGSRLGSKSKGRRRVTCCHCGCALT